MALTPRIELPETVVGMVPTKAFQAADTMKIDAAVGVLGDFDLGGQMRNPRPPQGRGFFTKTLSEAITSESRAENN